MRPRIKELLSRPGLERLNDWASIGPVQRAALEEFVELVVLECARGGEGEPDRNAWGYGNPWHFGIEL
jgi:hypothetical protein